MLMKLNQKLLPKTVARSRFNIKLYARCDMTNSNQNNNNDGKNHGDKRGFASMAHEKVQEIAHKGGEASAQKAGHQRMAERNRKGGSSQSDDNEEEYDNDYEDENNDENEEQRDNSKRTGSSSK